MAFFYAGAVLMGLAQALFGLFIATADLGVSLGGILMGPLADLCSYSAMYMICAALCALMIGAAYGRREMMVGTS